MTKKRIKIHGKDRETAGTLKKRRICRTDEKTGDEKTGFYCTPKKIVDLMGVGTMGYERNITH